MFKRFFFLLILATIAFFIYRQINPAGANNLVNKIKQTYNRILGKEELTGTVLTGELLTGDLFSGGLANLSGDLNQSGALLSGDTTGTILNDEGGMINGSGSQILETETPQDNTGAQDNSTSKIQNSTSVKSSTSSNGGLSSKDIKDTKNLMENLFK